MISVDVLTVLAPGERPLPQTLEALAHQGCPRLIHHLIEGPPPLRGEFRASTIARARNNARGYGTAPYQMFLDSDVVLPPLGVENLLFALLTRPHHAALGIDYQQSPSNPGALHVAMGATLFHRCVLDRLRFRAEPGLCECSCCCTDLRRMGYRIDYLPGIQAQHLKHWRAKSTHGG